MKGLLLAGGNGTRMWPTTRVTSKHLLPCYDKPTIYYPLSTLIELGCDHICVVCRWVDHEQITTLLSPLLRSLNISLQTVIQDKPLGLAHAILAAEKWIADQPFWMILGDNIFYPAPVVPKHDPRAGCVVFTSSIEDPRAFGVVSSDPESRLIRRIEEKPKEPFSSDALTGLYWFDHSAVARAKKLQPSARGELEITDLIRSYIGGAYAFPHEGSWFDNGTPDGMMQAGTFIAGQWWTSQRVIGSPEQAAFAVGRISKEELGALISRMPDCQYRAALMKSGGMSGL